MQILSTHLVKCLGVCKVYTLLNRSKVRQFKKVIIFMVAVLQCFQVLVLQFHVKLVSFYRRDSTKCSRSFTTF